MRKTSKSVVKQPDYLGIISELKLTVGPSITGGWVAWTEVDGRESETKIVRGIAPTLEEVILDMKRRSHEW